MDDLISRQAAIDAVRELYIQSPKTNNDIVYDMAIDQAHDALVNLPSAQPEITEAQVKEYCEKRWLVVLTFDAFQRLKSAQPGRNKGKWKVCGTFGDFLKCSCCGYKKPWNEDVFNFCPNCGAEMEDK